VRIFIALATLAKPPVFPAFSDNRIAAGGGKSVRCVRKPIALARPADPPIFPAFSGNRIEAGVGKSVAAMGSKGESHAYGRISPEVLSQSTNQESSREAASRLQQSAETFIDHDTAGVARTRTIGVQSLTCYFSAQARRFALAGAQRDSSAHPFRS